MKFLFNEILIIVTSQNGTPVVPQFCNKNLKKKAFLRSVVILPNLELNYVQYESMAHDISTIKLFFIYLIVIFFAIFFHVSGHSFARKKNTLFKICGDSAESGTNYV